MRLKAEVVDSSFSVTKFRQDVDKATAKMKILKGVTTKQQNINKLEAEWIILTKPIDNKVLLYIHGGGFISDSFETHRMHVAKFAIGSQLKALAFYYRLALENPFPAGLEDCVSAYKWLLKDGYKSQNIIIGCESAGGTLTLSLLLALKEQSISLPKAAFAISPVIDLRCLADSFKYNAKKDIAPIGSWDVWTKFYFAHNDPTLPLLSPQMGNYECRPPLFICVGTHEIHYDDCINVARKAKEQVVEVTLSEWPKMIHAFPLFSPLFPDAKQAMADICEFVIQQLKN